METIEKESYLSKVKFSASKTSSWHRAFGVRWWTFQKDWKFEISLWFFEMSWSYDEHDYPF